jgi:hypothetical protein
VRLHVGVAKSVHKRLDADLTKKIRGLCENTKKAGGSSKKFYVIFIIII